MKTYQRYLSIFSAIMVIVFSTSSLMAAPSSRSSSPSFSGTKSSPPVVKTSPTVSKASNFGTSQPPVVKTAAITASQATVVKTSDTKAMPTWRTPPVVKTSPTGQNTAAKANTLPPVVKLPKNFESIQTASKSANVKAVVPPPIQVPTKKLKPESLKAVTGTKLEDSMRQRRAATIVKEQEAKFKKPPIFDAKVANTSSPIYQRTVSSPKPIKEYTATRDRYYRNYNSRDYDFAYRGPSSSGIWDGLFLGTVIGMAASTPSHAQFAYHHWNDPDFLAYRQSMQEEAKSNPEVAEKLKAMEAKVKELEATNLPKDPNFLPEGVDPAVAMATAVAADVGEVEVQDVPTFTMGTGGTKGVYYKFGEFFKQYASGFNVDVVSTAGGAENLENYPAKYQFILVPSDVIDISLREKQRDLGPYQMPVYPEFMYLLANEESGIKTADDLDPNKHVVYVGPKGSGVHKGWNNIAYHAGNGWFGEKKYSQIKTMNASYDEALEAVSKNKSAVFFYEAGLNAPLMKDADTKYAGKLRLVQFDESEFTKAKDKDGNAVYVFDSIPRNTYPNLQKGFLSMNSVDSLSVQAVLVIDPEVFKKYPGLEENINAAIMLATQSVREYVGAN